MSISVLGAPVRDHPRSALGNRAGRGPSRAARRDLEGLRALAVLGVVVFHLRASWLPGGFAGVDVFFVLSGFLITGLLLREADRNGAVDLLAFWGRRARRLLPASGLVLVVTLLGCVLVADVLHAANFARDAAFAALFSLNWRLAHDGTSYFTDPAPSPFVHYWSLGVEEQFYLVWPVLVAALAWAVRRRSSPARSRAPRRLLLLVIVALSVTSFALALRQTQGLGQPYAYFATYARVWQLGLGAVLAIAAPALTRLPGAARTLARDGGVALIVGFYLLAPPDVVYPGWAALTAAGGAALVIAAGVAEGAGDPLVRLLGSPPAQALGRYSYGWYLWHWPPLVLLPYALGHPLHARGLIGCAVATLVLAALSYHLLEQPVRASAALARGRGARSLLLGVLLIALALGTASAVVALSDQRAAHTGVRTAAGQLLTPQPGAAAAELPQPSRDGCEVSLSSTALSPECRYRRDTGHGDVVLAGDSHAVQWFPAVDAIARRHRWGLRVWARASCPLADVTKVVHHAPALDCNRWRRDVMARLLAARPALVIVSGYASVVPSLYDPSTGRLVGGAAARRLYEDGLRRQLQRLRAAGIAVLVLRDNPSFDRAGPTCVLANVGRLSACSAALTHALRSAADLRAATSVAGVTSLDLTDHFCRRTRCAQVLGSTLAYRDTNHLTVEMVSRLRPQVEAAALAALRR